MDKTADIISTIKRLGPVVPADIATALKTDQIIAGAMLSELVHNGRVLLSHLKIGGSPLYYLAGQEEQLCRYEDKLNEIEQKAYRLIKEQKIINAAELSPVQRVALTNIPDFAKQQKIKSQHGETLYFRWFLVTENELEASLKQKEDKKKGIVNRNENAESSPNTAYRNTEAVAMSPTTIQNHPEDKAEDSKQKNPEIKKQIASELNKSNEPTEPEPTKKKEEHQTQLQLQELQRKQKEIERKIDTKQEPETAEQTQGLMKNRTNDYDMKKKEKPTNIDMNNEKNTEQSETADKKTETKKPKPKKIEKNKNTKKKTESTNNNDEDFETQLRAYFSKNKIRIIELEMIRKNKEFDGIVEVPSNLGAIRYYCKAKNKIKGSDGDLGLSYAVGQKKNLPVLFICKSGLTKKAESMLENEFSNVITGFLKPD